MGWFKSSHVLNAAMPRCLLQILLKSAYIDNIGQSNKRALNPRVIDILHIFPSQVQHIIKQTGDKKKQVYHLGFFKYNTMYIIKSP